MPTCALGFNKQRTYRFFLSRVHSLNFLYPPLSLSLSLSLLHLHRAISVNFIIRTVGRQKDTPAIRTKVVSGDRAILYAVDLQAKEFWCGEKTAAIPLRCQQWPVTQNSVLLSVEGVSGEIPHKKESFEVAVSVLERRQWVQEINSGRNRWRAHWSLHLTRAFRCAAKTCKVVINTVI